MGNKPALLIIVNSKAGQFATGCVVATGATHHYFGNDEWDELAPGLKTVEDALYKRRRILLAFEAALAHSKDDSQEKVPYAEVI